MSRYWVGVASLDHVQKGVEGGFCQLCHGKRAPVVRLSPGDWIVFYSPRSHMRAGEAIRAFTAIGRVKEGSAYPFDMGGGFVPTRRDVEFVRNARAAAIAPMLSMLSFSRERPQSWGQALRRGLVEIERADLLLIAEAMGASAAVSRLA